MQFKIGLMEVPDDTEEEKQLHEQIYGKNNEKLWKQWYSTKRQGISDESEKYDPNEHFQINPKEKPPSDPNKEK